MRQSELTRKRDYLGMQLNHGDITKEEYGLGIGKIQAERFMSRVEWESERLASRKLAQKPNEGRKGN